MIKKIPMWTDALIVFICSWPWPNFYLTWLVQYQWRTRNLLVCPGNRVLALSQNTLIRITSSWAREKACQHWPDLIFYNVKGDKCLWAQVGFEHAICAVNCDGNTIDFVFPCPWEVLETDVCQNAARTPAVWVREEQHSNMSTPLQSTLKVPPDPSFFIRCQEDLLKQRIPLPTHPK